MSDSYNKMEKEEQKRADQIKAIQDQQRRDQDAEKERKEEKAKAKRDHNDRMKSEKEQRDLLKKYESPE